MDTHWGIFSVPIKECAKFATKTGLKKNCDHWIDWKMRNWAIAVNLSVLMSLGNAGFDHIVLFWSAIKINGHLAYY